LRASESRDIDKIGEEAREVSERVDELLEQSERREAANRAARGIANGHAGISVGSEPLTYEKHSRNSYFADMIRSQAFGDHESRERLQRHAQEMAVEQRAVSRVDTTSAGEFVPPLWLVDQYGQALRPGRVVAELCTQ